MSCGETLYEAAAIRVCAGDVSGSSETGSEFCACVCGDCACVGRDAGVPGTRFRNTSTRGWRHALLRRGSRRICRRCFLLGQGFFCDEDYDERSIWHCGRLRKSRSAKARTMCWAGRTFRQGNMRMRRCWRRPRSAIVGKGYNSLIPLINSMEQLGRAADAETLRRREMEVLQEQLQHFPDDVRARVLLASDMAIMGMSGAAMQVKIAAAMWPNDPNILYNGACTYGLLGMKKDADGFVPAGDEVGIFPCGLGMKDPDLKILHDDPEFRSCWTYAKSRNNLIC